MTCTAPQRLAATFLEFENLQNQTHSKQNYKEYCPSIYSFLFLPFLPPFAQLPQTLHYVQMPFLARILWGPAGVLPGPATLAVWPILLLPFRV